MLKDCAEYNCSRDVLGSIETFESLVSSWLLSGDKFLFTRSSPDYCQLLSITGGFTNNQGDFQ